MDKITLIQIKVAEIFVLCYIKHWYTRACTLIEKICKEWYSHININSRNRANLTSSLLMAQQVLMHVSPPGVAAL